MDEFAGRRTFWYPAHVVSVIPALDITRQPARLGGMEQRMKQITANWLAGLGIFSLLCISGILE